MNKLYKWTPKRFLKYKKDQQGATAIEFAFLAIPFFMLIFAILELSIIFFYSSSLNHSVSEVGRKIRVGNFQSCSQDQFKEAVCKGMNTKNCLNRLRLDVVSENDFRDINLPVLPDPPTPNATNPNPPIPNGQYDSGVAGEPMVIRAVYYYKLILPPQLTRLENLPGTGIHRISASTAFRNEPFPSGSPSTCT